MVEMISLFGIVCKDKVKTIRITCRCKHKDQYEVIVGMDGFTSIVSCTACGQPYAIQEGSITRLDPQSMKPVSQAIAPKGRQGEDGIDGLVPEDDEDVMEDVMSVTGEGEDGIVSAQFVVRDKRSWFVETDPANC